MTILVRKIDELTPERVNLGLGARALNIALSGLGTLGTILDTPGSVIRGLVAGEPGRAFGGIFDPRERVSGSELVGKDKDDFSFAGLAAELVLDPINFLTFGTTSAAGKLAARVGKLADVRAAQQAILNVAPEASKVSKFVAENLRQTDEALASLADTAPLKKTFADQARAGQRALVGLRLPFQKNQINLIQGAPVFEAAAKVKSTIARLPGVEPTVLTVKKGFKRTADDPVVEAFRQELRNADRLAAREVLERKKVLTDTLKRLRNEFGEQVDDEIRRVVEITEIPEKLKLKDISAADDKAGEFLKLRLKVDAELSNVPEPIKKFADELRKINKELLDNEIAAGAAIEELDDLIGFFARQTTPKGAKFFESKRVRKFLNNELERLRLETASTQQQRSLKGLPTDELERKLRARFPERVNKIGLGENDRIFDNDIVRLQARRELQGRLIENRAIFAQAVVDQFKSTKGVPVGELIRPVSKIKGRNIKLGPLVTSTKLPLKGVRSREDFLNDLGKPIQERVDHIDIPLDATPKQIQRILKKHGVEERFIEPEIFDDVAKLFKAINDPLTDNEFTAPFIKVMDTVHGIYRAALTGYFPSFHSRNAISGVFMNVLAGDIRPRDYIDALFRLRNIDDAEHLRLAAVGVLGEGKIRETVNIIRAPGETIVSLPKIKEGKIVVEPTDITKLNEAAFAPARKVGQAIEDVNRLALFLAKKRAGLTDLEAAEQVRRFHFDYNDLTDFERAIPRRAILFYTFTRNNLPLMLEEFFKNPRFLQAYSRLTGQTNPNIVQPEWLPDSFFFPDSDKDKSIRINFGLPPEDLARFDPDGRGLQRVLELLITNAVPAIRIPFEFATGRSAFLGRPLEGSAIQRVAEASPASRVVAQIQRLIDAPSEGRLPQEIFRQLSGITIREIDEPRQRIINQADLTRDRLQELVRQGRARFIPVVGNRSGQSDEEVNTLNRALARLQAQLRE